MPIALACPRCGRMEYASSTMAGKRWQCPACGQSAMVPQDTPTENPVMLLCPGCDSELRVVQQLLGKQVRCNTCGMVLTVSGDSWHLFLVRGESVARPPDAIPAPSPPYSPATSSGMESQGPSVSPMVRCKGCGVGLHLMPEHVSKGARCPKCGLWIVEQAPVQTTRGDSPRQAAPSPAPASQSIPRPPRRPPKPCPSCGALLSPSAMLCVACGYNLQTGQRVQGADIESTTPRTCSVCGTPLAPGQPRCVKCGISVRATEVEVPRPKPKRPSWPYAAGAAGLLLMFVVVGVQCVRVLRYDYRQQFRPLVAECQPIAKFSLPAEPPKEPVGKCIEGKVLVCEEDGRVCDGFTDPDLRPFLPRKMSEVRSIVFLRKALVKAKTSVSDWNADAPAGAAKLPEPIVQPHEVHCWICVVDCASKSLVAEDFFVIAPPSQQQDVLSLAFSGGTGPVAASITNWIQQRLLGPGEVSSPPSFKPAEPATKPGPTESAAPVQPEHPKPQPPNAAPPPSPTEAAPSQPPQTRP